MKSIIISIISATFLFFISCSKELENPSADFKIEVDTIIDDIKQRIEVDNVKVGEKVFFVSQNNSMFSSIWTGDSTSSRRGTTYHDYNNCDSEIKLRTTIRDNDTSYFQLSKACFGEALPFGSAEMGYTYEFPGTYTITWVASNRNADEAKTVTSSKIITVSE